MKRRVSKKAFVRRVWKWYEQHKRDLPWRDLWQIEDDADRAYRILVSEIMLQQTQVTRVMGAYPRFLEQFPSIQDLGCATNQEILIAWRGMGYNSRALRLRDACREIVLMISDQGFPREMNELMSLKGIGHYTAAAIRNFAFGIPTPCIETNIRRVLHTEFIGPQNADGTWREGDTCLLEIAKEVLDIALYEKTHIHISGPTPFVADWHHALMDYGALALPRSRPITVNQKKEPGRTVGSRFIPNRIFRGKIIEELRDERSGCSFAEIGRRVCIDWQPDEHAHWLKSLLRGLEKDSMIECRGKRFLLKS